LDTWHIVFVPTGSYHCALYILRVGGENMDASEYLSVIIDRLKQRKYQIQENIKYKDLAYDYVAKRTAFEIERGAFFTTFFLFSRLKSPDIATLQAFSHNSYKFTTKSFRINLPPIFFWCLRCFPVAIVDSLDKEADDATRFKEPRRHFGAFEKLVVFNLKTRFFSYYTLFNARHGLYDDSDRNMIKEMLTPLIGK
jgi:hypothetical protein